MSQTAGSNGTAETIVKGLEVKLTVEKVMPLVKFDDGLIETDVPALAVRSNVNIWTGGWVDSKKYLIGCSHAKVNRPGFWGGFNS